MFPRAKANIGEKTPVTVPQIWLDGDYIGGADQLSKKLGVKIPPQKDRARSSLSQSRGLDVVQKPPRFKADAGYPSTTQSVIEAKPTR